MSVRVRYAPSPTGSPHVGNIRTALFCYLFARNQDGTMVVRIEDTDRSRYVPGCEEEIIDSIKWVGIEHDEGPDVGGPMAPYRQSERKEAGIYEPIIAEMLAKGIVYKAFDTPQELDEMREFQQINKQPMGYFGGIWRDASPEQVAEAEAAGKPCVLRLRMPRGKTLVCQDAIRGRIEWESDHSDDPVLIKADGMPTYHFAAMVDDHLMGTTHIIRGEEWISSAPKHVWLFEAMGWKPPIFVHVPVIKGKDGSKLSKRHGDTRCLDFRSAGYLPEALANFIALIGWSPGGDREVLPPKDLIEAFSLDGLQPSPGVFDMDKLRWMNGQYIRSQSIDELAGRILALAELPDTEAYWLAEEREDKDAWPNFLTLISALRSNPGYAKEAMALEQERVTTLIDFGTASRFFFDDEVSFDEKAVEKWKGQPHFLAMADHFIEELKVYGDSISAEVCEKLIRDYAALRDFEKLGPVVHPVRVALTGKTSGPGLFELMSVLGPRRMIARFERAKSVLG
jgi:glutamyl-tRNA synthetase